MNTDILKRPTFWVAVFVAVAGIATTQGLIVDGSTPAQVLGWIMTIIGSFFGGKVAEANKQLPAG